MFQFDHANFTFGMVIGWFCFQEFLNRPFFILIEVLIPEAIHGLDLLLILV